MKRVVILFLFLLLLSFKSFTNSGGESQKSFLNDKVSRLISSTQNLVSNSEDFKKGKVGVEILQSQIIETRKNFKELEFLMEYFFPTYVEDHINGAPLLKSKRHSSSSYVVPPKGLQVLDELIFSDEVSSNGQKINLIAVEFQNQIIPLCNALKSRKISRPQLAEAMRIELIRIFTLGLSGYDTPGSLNALSEAISSFQSMKWGIVQLNANQAANRNKTLLSLCDGTIKHLEKNQNFNKFDRLYFLMNFINPLFDQLTIEAKSYQFWKKSPLNPNAKNIFDPSLLDPYYYTVLKREEDSKELKNLGKMLFFDKRLSETGKISCASCHKPEKAFSDGKAKSPSNNGKTTVLRNSPSLLNAVYADRYFYDLRAFSLEQQAEHVIFNSEEFNTAYGAILEKLKNLKEYRREFKKIKGAQITREVFSMALSSYVLSLQSFNSPFDKFVRGENPEIDPRVKEGFNLFMGKAACGTCHFAPSFSGLVPPMFQKNESEILGVINKPFGFNRVLDEDKGRLDNEIHSEHSWIYEKSFKTVSLRNVELTAPYFHNGAFSTLEEVMEFYNNGGGEGIGLEVKNQTLASDSLHLTALEKEAIILFMKSLTDNSAAENLEG